MRKEEYYDDLETKMDEKALADFRKPAYQSVSVSEYIRRKYGKGSDADGRSDDKRTAGVIPEQ